MFLHFSAKKVECAKHQWIHLVGDQPESPQAFEKFVVNACGIMHTCLQVVQRGSTGFNGAVEPLSQMNNRDCAS